MNNLMIDEETEYEQIAQLKRNLYNFYANCADWPVPCYMEISCYSHQNVVAGLHMQNDLLVSFQLVHPFIMT